MGSAAGAAGLQSPLRSTRLGPLVRPRLRWRPRVGMTVKDAGAWEGSDDDDDADDDDDGGDGDGNDDDKDARVPCRSSSSLYVISTVL